MNYNYPKIRKINYYKAISHKLMPVIRMTSTNATCCSINIMVFRITGRLTFLRQLFQANSVENIKGLHYWFLLRQSTGGIPSQKKRAVIQKVLSCHDIMIICRFHGPLARYVKLRVRMRWECREGFPHHRRLAIPTCITARVWRTCRDACWDR